ncbi:MAG: dihydropteroate synthase [Thermomicrobiales bacterium]
MTGPERHWQGLSPREPGAPLPPTVWGRHALAWGRDTHLMAVLNVTPDSFSGDGLAGHVDAAIAAALRAADAGAAILDLGAESTRPGHTPVPAAQQIDRLLPVLQAVRPQVDTLISVDTSKAAVAQAALDAGANIVNDIRGFRDDPELADVVAAAGVPAVLMHDIKPEPGVDIVTSMVRELSRRLDFAVARGVAWERLIIDPGFGFGKDWRQNLELLRRLSEFRALGRPLLAGLSRKSVIGRVLGRDEQHRLEGTAAVVALAIAGGADIVRVHDIAAMAQVVQMADAVARGAPVEGRSWPGGPPA